MPDTDRPSMKQDWHPDHNMPTPEHDGVGLGANTSDAVSGRRTTRENLQEPKVSDYTDTGNYKIRQASEGLAMAKAMRP